MGVYRGIYLSTLMIIYKNLWEFMWIYGSLYLGTLIIIYGIFWKLEIMGNNISKKVIIDWIKLMIIIKIISLEYSKNEIIVSKYLINENLLICISQ
jgi:hypothetical protein